VDFDIIAGYYLSCGGSKILGGKASIIADNQALFVKARLLEIFGHGLGTDAYIVKGEILSDNSPPPIGAKLDWARHMNSFAQLHSQSQRPGIIPES
jgi:hypothetical protein